jgi:hypothetical protein
LLLALPILDFGAISARSQLVRLESGTIKAEEFDWTAMAFDFGPEGRERLAEIANSGPVSQRTLAKTALDSKDRYALGRETESVAQQSRLGRNLRILSPDIAVTDVLKAEVTGYDGCNDRPCALMRLDAGHLLLVYKPHDTSFVQSRIIDLAKLGKDKNEPGAPSPAAKTQQVDLGRAAIEVRPVQRRQLYVDGQPVGEPFE